MICLILAYILVAKQNLCMYNEQPDAAVDLSKGPKSSRSFQVLQINGGEHYCLFSCYCYLLCM